MEHPKPGEVGSLDAVGYLSASTAETDCTGFLWPARLLLVEPVGDVWTPHPDKFPRKRAAHTWRVLEELPAWRLFGPQGREVAALIEQAAHMTSSQIEGLAAVQGADLTAVRVAALDAVLGAARDAAWRAVLGSVRVAVRDAAPGTAPGATYDAAYRATQDAALGAAYGTLNAALGLLVKDLISTKDFRTLTGPWAQAMGPIEVGASTAHTEVNHD